MCDMILYTIDDMGQGKVVQVAKLFGVSSTCSVTGGLTYEGRGVVIKPQKHASTCTYNKIEERYARGNRNDECSHIDLSHNIFSFGTKQTILSPFS